MDSSDADQREEHKLEPNVEVSLEELEAIGVKYWSMNADIYEDDPKLQAIRDERGYTYKDIINVAKDTLPNYEQKIKAFFEEHMHTDEVRPAVLRTLIVLLLLLFFGCWFGCVVLCTRLFGSEVCGLCLWCSPCCISQEIRYILDGSGYFDVRNKGDEWIRIAMEKGDMIVLPPGIYHRFTLDNNNYIKAMRLFQGEPVWTPFNRPQDSHPVRVKYVTSVLGEAAPENLEREAKKARASNVDDDAAEEEESKSAPAQ